ncbi:MAG: hypothetical protein IT385_06305 [Deltaproteobacteria bacterium]|nr:hypothetical protein [Deltaproteobacteria bacterium]
MLKSLVVALVLFGAGPALAEPTGPDIEVEVTVIHATKGDAGVAPDLAPLGKYLLKSFAPYTTFTRLDHATQRLAAGAEARLALANKSELVYRHAGKVDGYFALHIEVGGLKSTVNVKDGKTFFQAGRAHGDGMIVLAFRVSGR